MIQFLGHIFMKTIGQENTDDEIQEIKLSKGNENMLY